MKNYKLYSLRLAKTGVVFGVNKFGHKWLEIRFKGKLVHMLTIVKPYNERVREIYLQLKESV